MALRANVGQSQYGRFGQLTLDGEIEVLGVRQSVVNVISGKIGHRLVNIKTEGLICRAARSRNCEGEALALAICASVQPISERLRELNCTGTGPVQAKRSIGHLVKEIQIFHRRVVNAICRTDTGLARSAKDFAQNSVAKAWRVRESNTRPEIVVSGRSKRFGNAGIAGIHESRGRTRKDG